MNSDQELYAILEATQQPDQAVRSDAENRLAQFQARPGSSTVPKSIKIERLLTS